MTIQKALTSAATGLLATMGLAIAAPASAGTVVLGDSGWEAHWHSSLNPYVDIDFMEIVDNTIFIQKSAEFTQGPVNGIFPSIAIKFRQVDESDITNIVIEDEIVDNNTGVAWTGFNMKLMDHGEVFFDVDQTANSGGGGPIGWSIDPFTTAIFDRDDTKLKISGGVVEDGESWFPGGGANDGQLWIDVTSGDEGDFTRFTLKERPSGAVIPGPSSLLALAGMLGFAGTSRRRRA